MDLRQFSSQQNLSRMYLMFLTGVFFVFVFKKKKIYVLLLPFTYRHAIKGKISHNSKIK